jgi:hypothetical protein
MKPKTTLNLFKINFPIDLLRLFFLLSFNLNRKPILVLNKVVLLFIFALISFDSYSQTCNATLQVHKNRFTKSVPPGGTSYSIQITNTGVSNTTYTLSAANINSSCSNNDGSNTSNNVNLNISFSDLNSNAINDVTLNSGETITFLVQVKIPTGTSVSKWNCTQITATANECSSYKLSTVLHTFVSDPTAD